jgi:hypothetical protein
MIARAKSALPATLILFGGLLALSGSDEAWGICARDPCGGFGGLTHLVTRHGFEFGTGVATAVVGLSLLLVGGAALRLGGSPPIRWATAGLAIIEFVLVGVHIARVHVFWEYRVYGPDIGLIAVIAGATVALAGAALLRQPRRDPPSDDRLRRPFGRYPR